jgi:hypothetical protein
LQQHYDALRTKLPSSTFGDEAAYLPYVGRGYCDEEHRAEIETFFKDRAAQTTGGPRILEQVLERVHLCSARREAQQAGVVEFLKNY